MKRSRHVVQVEASYREAPATASQPGDTQDPAEERGGRRKSRVHPCEPAEPARWWRKRSSTRLSELSLKSWRCDHDSGNRGSGEGREEETSVWDPTVKRSREGRRDMGEVETGGYIGERNF